MSWTRHVPSQVLWSCYRETESQYDRYFFLCLINWILRTYVTVCHNLLRSGQPDSNFRRGLDMTVRHCVAQTGSVIWNLKCNDSYGCHCGSLSPYFTGIFYLHFFRTKVKVKLRRGGPWRCETSRLPYFLYNRLTDGLLAGRPPCTAGRSLVLISVGSSVESRAIMRLVSKLVKSNALYSVLCRIRPNWNNNIWIISL
jgi:hypothetical protein